MPEMLYNYYRIPCLIKASEPVQILYSLFSDIWFISMGMSFADKNKNQNAVRSDAE